jgi:outer membrane immunogenic protein
MSFGQDPVDKSKLQFNVGVGLSTWGIPIYVGADYWATQDITIGIEGSFRFTLLSHYTYFGGLVNANYHVNRLLELPEEFDVYGGISIGPYLRLYRYSTPHLSMGGGLQIGGRYHINDKMAFHVEVGGGFYSGGKAGLTFRF